MILSSIKISTQKEPSRMEIYYLCFDENASFTPILTDDTNACIESCWMRLDRGFLRRMPP